MWINRAKYDNLLKCLDEAICNNYKLRKVCQCKECKWGTWTSFERTEKICCNIKSNNYQEFMNPYGSCEKCERR